MSKPCRKCQDTTEDIIDVLSFGTLNSGTGYVRCNKCKGDGKLRDGRLCHRCNGDGRVECPRCGGSGRLG